METPGPSNSILELKRRDSNTKIFSRNQKSHGEKAILQAKFKEKIKAGKFHDSLIEDWTFHGDVDTSRLEEEDLYKTNRSGRNLIHQIITESSVEEMPLVLTPQVLKVIQLLVLRDPAFFTAEDNSKNIPIREAAKFQLPVLFHVLDLLLPTSLYDDAKLQVDCQDVQVNCPLWQVPTALREHFSKETDQSSDESIHQDSSNTCLHDKIDVHQLVDYNKNLQQCLRTALHHQECSLACLEAILHDRNFDRDSSMNHIDRLETFKVFLSLCPDSIFGFAPFDKFTPLQIALRLYSKAQINFEMLFGFVQLLINRAPWSIFIESGHSAKAGNVPKTAYQILKDITIDNTPEGMQAKARAEELLKKACIGYEGKMWDVKTAELTNTITSEDKIRYLYSDIKSDGISEVINKAYIETIKNNSGLKFETTLEFVKLPYWSSQQSSPLESQPSHNDKHSELDPYIHLFEWLWDSGTKKIFRLDIDDVGPEPHTNAGIREALKGNGLNKSRDFEIEIWKWKKFDICTETVSFAAPEARHVHLWSSGNTAVLRGWASGSGLAKLQHLEKLTIKICPKNKKDANDCEEYLEEFKLSLQDHCKKLKRENIFVHIDKNSSILRGGAERSAAGDGQDVPNDMSEETPSSEDWLAKLKDFQEFIGLLNQGSKQTVRVAILDDGFRLIKSWGKNYKAQSFCQEKELYFAGSCEHGTEMATCVWEVCPWAELFIGRLDDTQMLEEQGFTIQSCCKALKWALAMEVEVISMSWTFPAKKDKDVDEYKDEFNSLIAEALRRNIVLFGSLPDRGPTIRIPDLVPIGLPGVIRIGSATVHGISAPENEHGGPDFLLPGHPKLDEGKNSSGSSYATAFASGLAATVLLAIKVYGNLQNEWADDTRIGRCLKQARTSGGMKKIFKRLSQQKPEAENPRGFYVRPYHTFRGNFETTSAESKTTLGDIVHSMVLCDLEYK
ncbi:hypothetical protein TRIATDRAFT_316834 [Trichoderma atroviride IMI 206040]|uniref:Peptidase S8/S53 domain-containing protein n=1 Tax=Hypocrea atroviridis (strain ATCC 20476 / IMI 206040) TaxID=452589 RepID=G9NP73_HYPAI|nr:uncharacterized protein TRIATDRAFT_316834 [Trichoderma atroviride IMI 206040]EHK47858.1 hypothetical protein TRIATDRAFT_316834 [Trichoderma atroviride IMI 206040]